MKITEPFTFAAVGDIIVRRPVGQLGDAGFQALTKVMRAADSTYANMEGPIIDEQDPNYRGPPAGAASTWQFAHLPLPAKTASPASSSADSCALPAFQASYFEL